MYRYKVTRQKTIDHELCIVHQVQNLIFSMLIKMYGKTGYSKPHFLYKITVRLKFYYHLIKPLHL